MRGTGAKLGATAFCLIFIAVGGGLGFRMTGQHLVSVVAARGWTEFPCEILASEVTVKHGDESSSWNVAVRYRYRVGGRAYEGTRFAFRTIALGRRMAEEDTRAYPPGAVSTCYVDPADPGNAVLDRSARKDLLIGLFPGLFLVFGLGFAFLVWFGSEGTPAPGASGVGPVVLRPKQSPLGKLVGVLFGNLMWNGFLAVVIVMVTSDEGKDGLWRILPCLSPFLLVGVLLLVGIPYQFLALFNPRPTVTLSTGSVRLGHEVDLGWRFSGPAFVLRRVEVALEGSESATYRVGTSTSTRTEVFLRTTLVDIQDRGKIREGSVSVTIPLHTMHTLEAGQNKIAWKLTLRGHIALWPDVLEEFPLRVLPVELVEG